jgi:hypothetical protein
MSRKVLSRFNGGIAWLNLVVTCVLALAAVFAAPSLAKAATGQISTINWRNGNATQQGYELEAMVVTNNVATVTFIGPGLSAEAPMYPVSNENGVSIYKGTVNRGSSRPKVGDIYSIKLDYLDTTIPTEYVKVPITAILGKDTTLGTDNFPTPIAPLGSAPSAMRPTFSWNSALTVPTDGRYSVTVTGPDLFVWSTEVPSSETSIEYSGDALTAGGTYTWAIATMDINGNKAEIRGSTFLAGATISGKVTDINGLPKLGIEVRATDITTGTTYESVYTAADGTYLYKGLGPGMYKVDFAFATYYYQNRIGGEKAKALEVADGASLTNVNAVIGGWGALDGFLQVTGSYKPAEAKVELLDLNKVPVPVSPATVPASTIQARVPLNSSGYGEFYIAPIRPGTYLLRFSAAGYSPVDKQVVITENQTLEGIAAPWALVSAPIPATLTVQTAGVGSGTVTSAPGGITCATTSTAGCSNSFPTGTPVTLSVTTSAGSAFSGWSGACTGTSASCIVTVDTAKSVTATFIQKPATVSIVGDSTPYFSIGKAVDFLAANNVTTAQTVLAKALVIVEDVIMVAPGQVSFKGGYTDPESASTFNTRTTTSRTTIDGVLKIRKGKFIPERLAIK